MSKVTNLVKALDPFRLVQTNLDITRDATNALGITTPEKVKREQRRVEAAAQASAAAAALASRNLAINSTADLKSSDNAPEVVAGGTASDLALAGGDMRRKRGSLSSQLGIRV